MKPTAHLPQLIAVTVLLVCLIAAAPAAARCPSQAVTESAALDFAAAKAPLQYESIWPHLLLKIPSQAIFMPAQLIERVRKTPSVEIFMPAQLVERARKTPSVEIFMPAQLTETVGRTPSVQIFRPAQIGR